MNKIKLPPSNIVYPEGIIVPPSVVSKRTKKKTVALIGFAPTTRHLAPWDDPDTEIWSLNEHYNSGEGVIPRWTRWFQMHPRSLWMDQAKNQNDPHHYDWLQKDHKFPIYMLRVEPDVPASVRFPLEDAMALTGKYFTSSFGYMIVLAMLEGFERIEVYGFEMQTGTEYAHQRPNAEFLIGFARGMGIDVYLPPQCGLCRDKLYGYEYSGIAFRQQLELRGGNLAQMRDRKLGNFNKLVGIYEFIDEIAQNGVASVQDILDRKEEFKNMAEQAGSEYNLIQGSISELDNIQRMWDHYTAMDAEI